MGILYCLLYCLEHLRSHASAGQDCNKQSKMFICMDKFAGALIDCTYTPRYGMMGVYISPPMHEIARPMVSTMHAQHCNQQVITTGMGIQGRHMLVCNVHSLCGTIRMQTQPLHAHALQHMTSMHVNRICKQEKTEPSTSLICHA